MAPSSTATIALKLETKDFATKANDASTALLGVQLAAGGTGLALKGMGAIARSSAAEFAIGAVAVDKFNTSLGKAATNAGKLSGIAGTLSTFAYNTALATTAISGLVDASAALNRIPQTIALINASGISTQTIAEFQQFKEAFLGNQEAVEGFVNTAISRLGAFEQAAARSATILKSSTRFDESGNALRVNGAETLANAMSIQALVTNKLDNAVTSQSALLAQYEVLSAGFAGQQDSEKVLETALKLTQIGQAGGVASNAGDNAKLLGKSLQAYSLSANDAARTGAILNAVVENGITTVPELSNGFGAAGSSAAKAGISMSALGAGVAQLTSLGQDTSEALTGLKGLSDAIITKTPEASAELAKLSLNGQRIRFDVAEIQAKGLVQALLDVNKAAGNSPQALAKIFPDAITSRAVTGLISGGGAGFKARFDAIDSATPESLDEVALKASDTRVNKMEKLANKFGEIVISVAQSVAPVVEPGLNALKAIADGFAALPDPIKQALGAWIATQVTIQSSAVGIGILVKTLGDLAGIYAIGRVISLAMTGQLGAELTVIKQLIVQRKGLGSVLLQTIGINQRHRLSVDAATAALTNQGVVANTVAAAQVRGANLVASASTRARDLLARNVAGARAAAAQFGATPVTGSTVNAAIGLQGRVAGVAAAVANSETGQKVRGAVGDFYRQNPAIGTAASEIKGVATTAIDKAKSAYSELANSDLVQNLSTQAKNKASEIGNSAKSFKDRVLATDSGAPDRARLQQMVDAELQLNKSKLLTTVTKNRDEFAKLDKETALRQRLQDGKKNELARAENSFNNRSRRLEEIKPNLSNESYEKGVAKLNRDAKKLDELRTSIQENAKPLAELQRDRDRRFRQLANPENQLATANIAAQQRFTPLVNLESRLQRVNAAADRAKEQSQSLETYAANINRAAPGTAQSVAANNASVNAAIRQSSLTGRAQALDRQYQELLTTSGARTALLSQQGLAQVRYGSGTATYSTNSKLESLLYADVGKSIKGAFESTTKLIGSFSLSGTFIYLRSTAQAAAAALGRVGEVGLFRSLREGLTALPSRLQNFGGTALTGARAAYAQGGVLGVARAGFGGAITGASNLGETLLPFLPKAIAGAVVAPAVVLAVGAAVLRNDFKRAQLAGEFRNSVDATLKKDDELRAKYEDRNRPLAELKAAVAQIEAGKTAVFSSKSNPVRAQTAVGSQQQLLDNTIGLPGKAIGGVSAGLGAVGNALNNTVAPNFKLDGTSTFKAIDPVREQLKLLAQSGQLTTSQFKDLDGTLSKMGASGKISASELAKFNTQIGNIASQEKPQARGVIDSIGNFAYNIPGAIGNATGNTIDYIANSFGSVLSGKTIEESAINREADALISYLGDGENEGSLTGLTNLIADANVDSRQNLFAYRQGEALDATNNAKLKAREQLTTGDLEREKLQTTSRIDRNNALVADYDTKLKDLGEQLAKQEDPGNKALLQNSIKAYTAQKDALLKNTEGLKASAEAFAKYNAETLPGLIRAVNESQDPTKAVGAAAEDFNQIYQKDSTGELTKYVKDIAQLRAEGAKYVEAIGSKYAIDNSFNADAEAVAGLKTARDNRITLPTGDSGFRETVAGRIALTDQIVKIQQAETQKLIAAKTIESEKLKVLVSDGQLASTEAQLKSTDIGIAIASVNLATKQKEIEEYAQFPRKIVELEQQAASLRIQLEQQVAEQQKAIRERAFSLTQAAFDLQSEYLKTAQSELRIGATDAIVSGSKIELDKARAGLQKLYEDRGRLTEKSPELDNQITKTEQQYAQQQATAQTQIFDAQLAVKKQILGVETTLATLPLTTANKQLETTQKILELSQNIFSTNKELITNTIDNQNTQLDNQSKLTNNSVDRAKIELTQSKLRLDNIGIVQSYERQSLVLQQELTALGLKQQQNQLAISAIENQRSIKELELQRLKLDRDKSNSPEIKAQRQELDAQLTTTKLQGESIKVQGELISKQVENNKIITDAKLKQNVATQATSTETARIDNLLKSINVKTAVITENAERQNLAFTAQVQKLNARSNALEFQTKQLDNQTKILTTQQGLISAAADSRVSELGIMDGLTTIESVKLNIAQQQATIKLSSLNSQVKLERDILELNIKQQQYAIASDKLKQQIAEKNAERDVILSRANVEKLQAKGSLADPRETQAAQLDLSAKLDAQVLTRSNRTIIAQQEQAADFNAFAQRQQLEYTQKNKLFSAAAEYSNTAPITDRSALQNQLFNAGVRQEGSAFYEELSRGIVGAAKLNPTALPTFSSPYSGNYNQPGGTDPTKMGVPAGTPTGRRLGDLDFTPRVEPPRFNVQSYEQLQQDARSRYAEFINNPINIQVSPQVRSQQQESRVKTEGASPAPVKPITLNLSMTNDIKVAVQSAAESKDTIVNSSLKAIEDVVRLAKERFN